MAAVTAPLNCRTDNFSDLLGHLPDLAQEEQDVVGGVGPQSVHLAPLPERQVGTFKIIKPENKAQAQLMINLSEGLSRFL